MKRMRSIAWAVAIVWSCASGIVPANERAPVAVAASELRDYWLSEKELQPGYSRAAMMLQLEGCFVAAYTIDATGQVRDARIVYQDATIPRANRMATRGSEAKLKKAAFESQASTILEALQATAYQPAPNNLARIPVTTRTLPIIVSMLSLERPDDAAAVARARARHETRRKALFDRCSAAWPDTVPQQ